MVVVGESDFSQGLTLFCAAGGSASAKRLGEFYVGCFNIFFFIPLQFSAESDSWLTNCPSCVWAFAWCQMAHPEWRGM